MISLTYQFKFKLTRQRTEELEETLGLERRRKNQNWQKFERIIKNKKTGENKRVFISQNATSIIPKNPES